LRLRRRQRLRNQQRLKRLRLCVRRLRLPARLPRPRDQLRDRQQVQRPAFRCARQLQRLQQRQQRGTRPSIRPHIQRILRHSPDRAQLLREPRSDLRCLRHSVRRRQALLEPRPLLRERRVRPERRRRASDSLLDPDSRLHRIRIDPARRKECVRPQRLDRFVPVVHRPDPASRRVRVALWEDFRSGPADVLDQNRSAASDPEQQVAFRKRSREAALRPQTSGVARASDD
jgi:hypothetical protein